MAWVQMYRELQQDMQLVSLSWQHDPLYAEIVA
jgi:hypothetical protein